MTFAGRYPPADPVKRGRFLAEREWWLNWRQKIPNEDYMACDCQENFYKFVRERIALDASDYHARITNIVEGWKGTAASEPADFLD